MMKNLKSKLVAAAMLIGLGSAMLSQAAPGRFANKTWGKRTSGVYVDLTGHSTDEYSCTGSSGVCTAVYPTTQNPNTDASNPISIQPGVFSGL
jgi:hypothetical protein